MYFFRVQKKIEKKSGKIENIKFQKSESYIKFQRSFILCQAVELRIMKNLKNAIFSEPKFGIQTSQKITGIEN